jgi:hypothetical protein
VSNYIGTSDEALDFLRSIHVRDRLILELADALREIVTAIESGDADGYSPSGDWFREAKATLNKVSGEKA